MRITKTTHSIMIRTPDAKNWLNVRSQKLKLDGSFVFNVTMQSTQDEYNYNTIQLTLDETNELIKALQSMIDHASTT